MRLSTRTEYAVGLLAALVRADRAVESGQAKLTMKEMAEQAGVSPKYAETVLQQLKKEGLIRSVRGRNGGYLLARPADKITALEIVETVDGFIMPDKEGANEAFASLNKCMRLVIRRQLTDTPLIALV